MVLTRLSGAQMGLFDEKTRGKQSCDRVPLNNILFINFYPMLHPQQKILPLLQQKNVTDLLGCGQAAPQRCLLQIKCHSPIAILFSLWHYTLFQKQLTISFLIMKCRKAQVL
jgi:hypothetical protein